MHIARNVATGQVGWMAIQNPFPFVVAWLPVRRGLSVHESLHLMGNDADTRRNSGTGTSPVRKYHEPIFLQTGAGSSYESVEKSIQRYMEVS